MCEKCEKSPVCKIMDVLCKFHEDAKKQLGVNITMDNCYNYALDERGGNEPLEEGEVR
jgi:uncharacterized protein YijF (DUF1287 family)